MKVTKQQKILGGIMLLGAVALIGDQFVSRGPSSDESAGSASQYSTTAANNAPAKTAPAAATPAPTATISVAQRLRQAGKGRANTVGDAFAPPAAWKATNIEPGGIEADNSAQQFREKHRLTGILTSGPKSFAVVDGKMITVGQSIDGFTLSSISHRSASFESGANKVVLTMTERTGATVSNVAP